MKANQQLLRLFVLPFFIFMTALPVLYQSQVLKENNDFAPSFLKPAQNPLQQDSLPADWFRYAVAQPWFDSAAFQTIIREGNYDPHVRFRIEMSGVGPDFRHFTELDTSLTLLALEMSYSVRRFSPSETAVFNADLGKIKRDVSFYGERFGQNRLALSDSIDAFVYGKLNSSGLDKLLVEALQSRDSVFLDSPGLFHYYSKIKLVRFDTFLLNRPNQFHFDFNEKLELSDTLWALKAIYKNTYLPKNK